MRSILKTTAMAAGVLAAGLIGKTAGADPITVDSKWQSGGPNVTVTYTTGLDGNNDPITATEGTTAGAFAISDPTDSSHSKLFDAYCVSLNVTVGTGLDSIDVDPVMQLHGITKGQTVSDGNGHTQTLFAYSAFTDVGNRLEYLLTTYGTSTTGGPTNASQDVRSALSLAIWNTIDANFKPQPGALANGTVKTLYTQYVDWTTNGYDSNNAVINPNAVLLVVTPPGDYQNLIGILPPGGPITPPGSPVAPEPASVISALIGLGAAGMFARRRAGLKAA